MTIEVVRLTLNESERGLLREAAMLLERVADYTSFDDAPVDDEDLRLASDYVGRLLNLAETGDDTLINAAELDAQVIEGSPTQKGNTFNG